MDDHGGVAFCLGVLILAMALGGRQLLKHLVRSRRSFKRSDGAKGVLPPGPPSIPILGNLHQLGGYSVHRSLAQLAHSTYGPLMFIRLGVMPTAVVSNLGLAREVLITNGHILTRRPLAEFARRMFYGERGLLMMDYGPHWRHVRRFCDNQLFNAGSHALYRRIHIEEARQMVSGIAHAVATPTTLATSGQHVINLRRSITSLTTNIATRIICGSTTPTTNEFQDMMTLLGELVGAPVFDDFLPWLRFLDIGGYKKRMDRLYKSIDEYLETLITTRVHERKNNGSTVATSFLDEVLSELSTDPESFTREDAKAILEDLLGASSDTIALGIEWVMAELLCNPNVLHKLQAELDEVMEKKQESTILREIPYLQAVIKESFRLHPPSPIVFRQVPKDKTIHLGGYTIPNNASVMVNLWAIGRDPNLWKSPDEYYPERFILNGTLEHMACKELAKDMDAQQRADFLQLVPFGAGRRRCIGMSMAMHVVELAVASLVYPFKWEVCQKQEDMRSECDGVLAVRKASPLMATPYMRLKNASSYDNFFELLA